MFKLAFRPCRLCQISISLGLQKDTPSSHHIIKMVAEKLEIWTECIFQKNLSFFSIGEAFLQYGTPYKKLIISNAF